MYTTYFYYCYMCGNIAIRFEDTTEKIMCCGEEMTLLEAKTADTALEKHVPVVEIMDRNVQVSVGSTIHPMEKKHYISLIYLRTNLGGYRKALDPGDEPIVRFTLKEEEVVVAAYEYCNQHGLWVNTLK